VTWSTNTISIIKPISEFKFIKSFIFIFQVFLGTDNTGDK
jgi:hypothetical protein